MLENYDYIQEIPYLDVYYGTPYGCSVTVTFKNPNYTPSTPAIENSKESVEESKSKQKTSFFLKIIQKELIQKPPQTATWNGYVIPINNGL